MIVRRRLIGVFFILFSLIAVLPVQSVFSQRSLDRISIADRSDGMGFVTRLHLSAAPDSFKVAHAGQHYIQVALYGVTQYAPRVINPERPFVIDSIHISDLPGRTGKLVELNLFREQFVRSNSYPDVNGRDILISLLSISRRTENQVPFVADNMIVSPYVDPEAETELAFQPEEQPVPPEQEPP